ncbi:RecB family exonuclease [Luteimicrobium subarcticum]|uniref:Putative RecB family exonuclease n=1 Tax=Luteimicrobium subarcticum TaxID=620910 RepID=A0A2M8W3L8_9MICO|nr:RecB family exonuclease [Luteimicrobium subarcticum]PJI85489.1 putative RecB family exonuclease [Luteimicrobium subarcticum]
MTGSTPRVPSLSPSRANDFLQCPLLFRFRTIDRLPEPPSPAAARGTLVHAVLEKIFDEPAGARTVERARELLGPAWERLREARPEYADLVADAAGLDTWLAGAGDLLGTYFTLEDPNRLEPRSRELAVSTQLDDGPLLRGIVDRLDVAPGGEVRVVDYKTGKSPRPAYAGSTEFQMRFYALVWWRETGVLPRMLQLVYLGDGQVLRAEPTAESLVATETKVRDVWSRITTMARAGEFPPRRSALCGWCAHQAHCPEFDGTPPPYPVEGSLRATGVAPG